MKKLRQIFKDNVYEIVDDAGKTVFSAQLDNDQIIIKTEQEVWAGPINLLDLSAPK